jgi:hypothetical protein
LRDEVFGLGRKHLCNLCGQRRRMFVSRHTKDCRAFVPNAYLFLQRSLPQQIRGRLARPI